MSLWNHLPVRSLIDANDRSCPVVPCDPAAVERAAQMLCREGMEFADGWVQGDTDRDYPRLIAEAVLRAAGKGS